MFRSTKGLSGFAQFGILLLFTGLGLILASLSQLPILVYILPKGVPLTNSKALEDAMMDPRNVDYTRLIQVISTFFFFFVPAILFTWVAYGKNLFWLGFNRFFNLKQIGIAFLLIMLANFAFAPLADMTKSFLTHFPRLDLIAKNLEDAYSQLVKVLSNLKSWPEYVSALAIMAFFPALFEEVFFRGVLQNLFVKWWRNPWIAIFVASIIFSLFHASVYLFLTRLALGCLLGFIYYETKNIWINVIAHFINNALALTQMFVMYKMQKPVDIENLDPHIGWWWSLLALLAVGVLFYLLKKISWPLTLKTEEKELKLNKQKTVHNLFDNN